MNPFEQLLKALGTHLGLTLHPDSNQACRIQFAEGPPIQIDLEGSGDLILMGASLGIVNPGIYREQLFKAALKANASSKSPRGTLAFSEKNSMLVLFQFVEFVRLDESAFFKLFHTFHAHASLWYEALRRGGLPEIPEEILVSSKGLQ